MKKLATLLLTAGLVFGAATGAQAIDFKAKGQFIMSFGVNGGLSGYSDSRPNGGISDTVDVYGNGRGGDNFESQQRIRLQLEAIASESLSGTVQFEMGNTSWGNAAQGGALGADGKIVEVKHAYIDWVVPSTELKVRMGLQPLGLPAFTTGTSQVYNDDVAGLVLSNKFNDNFALTFFWARPYNDNFTGVKDNPNPPPVNPYGEVAKNYLDNVDMFGLLLPMTFDGFKVTPWFMYSAVGQNAFRNPPVDHNGKAQRGASFGDASWGLLPVNANGIWSGMTGPASANKDMLAYGSVWNAGLTGEITAGDPFRFAWDLNYGAAEYGVDYLSREGFYGSLLAEYKMNWGTPGIYFWYSTGDDDDIKNGSERMAINSTIGGTNEFSNFAFTGAPYITPENVIANSMVGTWGVGVRLKDMSFIEDLTHTFRINYIGGTNSPEMAKYLNGAESFDVATGRTTRNYAMRGFTNGGAFDTGNGANKYMTTTDYAIEFGLANNYQIYENLNLFVDANYMVFHFDHETWGNGYSGTDAFNVNASFVYSF